MRRTANSQPPGQFAELGSSPALVGFSGFHTPCLEFFCSGAERSELVNGRARWREREGREAFGEHLVEVIQRGDAGTYVRAEPLTGLLRNERRHVLDQQPIVPGSSCGAVNAPIGPVSTVNGATAAINDCCNVSKGGVGRATMPATPTPGPGA
jgi:hypothetical protein